MSALTGLPVWGFLAFAVLVMLFALLLVGLVVHARRAGTEVKVHLLPPKIEIRTVAEAGDNRSVAVEPAESGSRRTRRSA
ncbi:hypothetical protein [Saccharothrix stipae]